MYAFRITTKPRDYRIERNIRWLRRRRDALLKKLRRVGPILDGSLVLIARRCGNSARCHCRRGPKHISTYLTYAVEGKTQTLYIPVDLQQDVRRWSDQYRALKQVIREVCQLQKAIIRRHVREQRRLR